MHANSERPSLSPAQLDAVTGALALQILSACLAHPPAVALIALTRAQAHVIAGHSDQEHAIRAANQMLRLYHAALTNQVALVAPGSPLVQ